MKQGNLDKWLNIPACSNLLFFSELVNELLFDYSIPSNRVATLNSHYLCLDAISAIRGIEKAGVPEGTLKPIAAELYITLKKDPVFNDVDNNPLKFFVKYNNDKFRISTKTDELNFWELKNAIYAIQNCFFKRTSNWYYETIKAKICDIVLSNHPEDQQNLFRLVKSLLTELINSGYSSHYIFDVMNDLFWEPKAAIECPDIINQFFDAFSFTKKEYTVIFAVNKAKMSKFIQYIDNLSFAEKLPQRTEQHSEKSFLTIKNKQAFLVVTRNAFDQYRAAQNARDMISLNTAFYRLCDHDYKYDINSARCGVYDDTKFYRVAQRKSALSHAKMPPSRQIEEYLNAADNALDSLVKHSSNDFFALLSAARFHAQSLDSTTSSQNQLLDLWAIFESVLDISNAHTSERISQICRYLVPILKRKYIYSLFSQLANDIKNYSEDDYLRIIEASETETEIVQKICEFVLLDTNADVRTEFLNSCSEYPLLKERIEYYSRMLSKPADVYAFVEKHAERVKWQIMRIYRNRNLIIHNGDNMPYLELLIENLHSYVDDFMSYLIHCLSEGATVRRMCQELFSKECEWLAEFSNSRAGMTSEVICKMLAV